MRKLQLAEKLYNSIIITALYRRIKHIWWLVKNYFEIAKIYLPFGFIKIKARLGGITLVEFRKSGPLGEIGESMHCIEDKVILRDVNQHGFLDKTTVNFFIDKIKVYGKDCDFIDIGANQGFVSLPILRHLQPNTFNTIFHLFEPQSMYFSCLQKNSEKYKNVKLYNYGLDFEDKNNLLYFSKRNATATLDPALAFDPVEKLTSENCYFKNAHEQIENILESNKRGLFIKSDVDHNDWEIFLTLKPLFGYIKAYVLELQLHSKDFSTEKRTTFLKEIREFDNFFIIDKQGKTVNKSAVPHYILNHSDIVNIYLFN